jgi:hypothetical protein
MMGEPGNTMSWNLYLPGQRMGVLYVPVPMTRAEYDLMARQIREHLELVAAIAVRDEPPGASVPAAAGAGDASAGLPPAFTEVADAPGPPAAAAGEAGGSEP